MADGHGGAAARGHHQRGLRLLFAVVFWATLSVPLVLQGTGVGPRPIPLEENRSLAAWPDFGSTPWSRWPGLLDAWFRDRLPLRSQLVGAYLRLWECGLEAPRNLSVCGRNGELFCQCPGGDTVREALGMYPLDRRQLVRLKLGYAGTQAFLALHGVPYVLVLVPSKTTLYPEWLPRWAAWRRGPSLYDQLLGNFAGTPIHVLDLLPPLRAQKAEHRLYDRRNDVSHWNGYGLDVGYREIGAALARLGLPVDAATLLRQYAVQPRRVELFSLGDPVVPDIVYAPTGARDASNEVAFVPWTYTWGRGKLLVNEAVPGPVVWALTDSYIAATHGSDRLPLAALVHEYLQFCYLHFSLPLAERLMLHHRPDAVVECFVERIRGDGGRADDPRIRMLGDALLGTPAVALTPEVAAALAGGARVSRRDGLAVLASADGSPLGLDLPPLLADADGRAVLMARLTAPAETVARLRYVVAGRPASAVTVVTADIKKGANVLHMTMTANPGAEIRARFEPGQVPGGYGFAPLPEVARVREMRRGL